MSAKISGIIFFGDSVLAGTGASARELGCAKLVKSALAIPVSLRARNWNTSQDALNCIKEDILKQNHFSHVIILFGNNDCWLVGPNKPKISLEQFQKNLTSIINQIKQNGQFPLLCTLQPIDFKKFSDRAPELLEYCKNTDFDPLLFQQQYSDTIKKLAEDFQVGCIDIRAGFENKIFETIATDGIHPNDFGHKIIFDSIISFLKIEDDSLIVSVVNQA